MKEIKDYTVRFFLVILLTLITVFTLIFSRGQENQIQKYQQAHSVKLALLYKVIYFQLVISYQFPDQNKKSIEEQILQQTMLLEKEYPSDPIVFLENFIIFNHLSVKKSYEDLNFLEEKYKDYYKIIYNIYNNPSFKINIETLKENPLKLSMNNILILDYLEKTEPQKAKEFFDKLAKDIFPFQLGLSLITFLMIFSFFVGLFVLVRFFSKPHISFYGSFIRNYDFKHSWVLLEAAVIYLFLYIPVNYFVLEIFKPYISNLLWFQIIYIVLIFILAIVYVYNEVGGNFIKYSLWTQVYSHQDFYPFLKNFQQEESKNKDFKGFLENMIINKKIKPLSPLYDLFYGFVAFVAIFPASMIILLSSVLISGSQYDVVSAHPISFLIPEQILPVFILAVIIAPITEEIVFRNWIYGFFRSRFSTFASSFLSAIIFASLHPQGVVAFPYLIFLGMALAVLREYRPGIIAPIVTHFCVNGLAVLMNYLFYKVNIF